ncbi:MAG TPA: hypothetical protein VNN80_18205, partial [Polyangiaceae bacterium]|nr:hypothetical protein [Polyangiaceae bacterium]
MGNFLNELDVQAALDLYREGLALARRTGRADMANQLVGNIGYSAFLSGDWESALEELDAVIHGSVALEPRDVILLLNNELVIRANRGDDITDGLAEIESMGKDMSGTIWHLFVADPQANAAMARGDLAQARSSYEEVAAADTSQAPEFFYRAFRAALWAGDLGEAKRLVAAQEQSGGYGPVILARRATMRAGIAALEGRATEALSSYREAMKVWRSSHCVWDEAMTGIDMAQLLDPSDPEVAEAIASTRSILERLAAKPYLERLEAAVARGAPVAKPARRASATAEVAVAE